MEEVDALKAIANVLDKLQHDERLRVLSWANAKYAGSSASSIFSSSSSLGRSQQDASGGDAKSSRHGSKLSKKAKITISMDKGLNLTPAGKISASEFASQKAPSNAMQKCVVAVFYLRDFLEASPVTTQAVFTYFKHVSWPVPVDIRNTLQKAGSMGWLDTADGEDIKLTSSGENLVEHGLHSKN